MRLLNTRTINATGANTTATKTMFALTVNPSRKGCASLRTGKNDIAHTKRRRVIVGKDEGWMKFATEAWGLKDGRRVFPAKKKANSLA